LHDINDFKYITKLKVFMQYIGFSHTHLGIISYFEKGFFYSV